MKIGHLAAGIVIVGGAAAAGAVVLRDKAALAKAGQARKAASKALESGDVAAAQSAYGDMWERASRVGRLTGQGASADELSAEARSAILDLEQLTGPLEHRVAALDAEGTLLGVEYTDRNALERELWLASAQRALHAESPATATALVERAAEAGAEEGQLAPLREELAARKALADAEQAARDGKFADAVRYLEAARLEGLDLPDARALRARVDSLQAVAGDTAKLEDYTAAVAALAERIPAELGDLAADAASLRAPSLVGGHEQERDHAGALERQVALHARIKQLSESFAGMVFVRRVGQAALFVDRFEVTNAAYAEFVEAGGYAQESYWSVKGQGFRARCVDDSGAPGPRGWSGGPPAGAENEPVRQVGFFEAEAYAAWAKKRLPTSDEWSLAADGSWSGAYAEGQGNVRETGIGAPADVGSQSSGAGALDLCGNVAEIVRRDEAAFVAIGGSYRSPWSEADPARATPLSPVLRASDVGFRCARDLELPWQQD